MLKNDRILTVVSTPTGDMFLQTVANSRQKIAQLANPFIRDGTVRFIAY